MTIKVRTPYHGNFTLPHSCVSCGAVPGPEMTLPVSGYKSNWFGKRTSLIVKMPLCPACHAVSRNKGWATITVVMGVVVGILSCSTVAGIIGSDTAGKSYLGIFSGLAVFLGFMLLAGWLSNLINRRGFTPEQVQRRKALKKCAYIISFSTPGSSDQGGKVVFQFENEAFATEFANRNRGQFA